jgi:hypothetical protein
MNVYIQSKSGDFNSSMGDNSKKSVIEIMRFLRECGSYAAMFRGRVIEVPFEEIQFIRELQETD